jgi:very-short-patch-repair endonuclease
VGVPKYMNKILTSFARRLRRDQTEAEKKIWKYLRSKKINSLKFRRQQPIGRYIVDFVCFEIKLIVELDGSQHIENNDRDSERDSWLRSQGFKVLRLWDNEVMNNVDGVLELIFDCCSNHPRMKLP